MSEGQASRVRRAVVCYEQAKGKDGEIHQRHFLAPGQLVPSCEIHGPMKPQPNAPYRGKRVP